MKKVLIFGGYGFIGNNLYLELKKNYIVSRYTSTQNYKNKILYNYKNFFKVIKNLNPDIIFFLSGTSNPDYKDQKYLNDLKKTNLVLQSLMFSLKALNFKGKIFYFSSIGVYGSNISSVVSEKKSLNPESFYALSKIIAEEQCKFFTKKYNLNINILRICSIFGPGLKRQIIYKIIKKISDKDRIVKFLGNVNDKREFLFIDDLILIVKKLMLSKAKRETFNIGSNKQYLISDIIKKILIIKNKHKKIEFLNTIKAPKLPLLSNKKLYRFIKIKKKFNLYLGLKKTTTYYK